MKLKNFLKKPKKEKIKENKTFNTNLKSSKKPNRADKKAKVKSAKQIFKLSIISGILFSVSVLLFFGVYLYSYYFHPKINNNEILSPGVINVVEIEKARRLLIEKEIAIQSFNYSSGSASLVLIIEKGPTVYFSQTASFDKQAELLGKILDSLKSEGRNAKIIDIRYNRPIVKF